MHIKKSRWRNLPSYPTESTIFLFTSRGQVIKHPLNYILLSELIFIKEMDFIILIKYKIQRPGTMLASQYNSEENSCDFYPIRCFLTWPPPVQYFTEDYLAPAAAGLWDTRQCCALTIHSAICPSSYSLPSTHYKEQDTNQTTTFLHLGYSANSVV